MRQTRRSAPPESHPFSYCAVASNASCPATLNPLLAIPPFIFIFAPSMKNIEAFKSLIGTPKKTVIVTHVKPDADALGSSLGLAGFLKKKGHKVQIITPTDYPDFLHWMPGNREVLIFQKDRPQTAKARIDEADTIFCLDFSSLKRINELGEMVKQSPATKILIDHHLEPEQFAVYEQWDPTAAS